MRTPRETWSEKIRRLWASQEVHGVELIFVTIVIWLRFVSISCWAKDVWLHYYLDWKEVSNKTIRQAYRDNLIDFYCIGQLLLLSWIPFWAPESWPNWIAFSGTILAWAIAVYVLFEMYLNLFSIYFVRTQKDFGPRQQTDSLAALNEPSSAVQRSVLLLFVNILQLMLAFAFLYRRAIPELGGFDALYTAVFVFATLDKPNGARMLVSAQIILDFLLIGISLASIVGQRKSFIGENS